MSNLVEHFRDERHYLSNQVSGNTITDKSDLKSEYRNYMLRNEEELNNMRLEINKLQDCLSQKSEKIMVSVLFKRKVWIAVDHLHENASESNSKLSIADLRYYLIVGKLSYSNTTTLMNAYNRKLVWASLQRNADGVIQCNQSV